MTDVESRPRTGPSSAAELRTVLGTITDGIQLFDADGVMLSRNPAAARLYGLDEAEPTIAAILDKWELLREDGSLLPLDERPLEVVRATGVASDGFMAGLRNRRDGSVRWLSVSTTPLTDDLGVITGYVSCTRDLTERMETIRALRILTDAARQLSASLVPHEVVTALTSAASELCSSPGERPRRAVLMVIDGETMTMSGLIDPSHSGSYADPRVPLAENPYARRVVSTRETLVTGFSADDFGPSSADVIRSAGVRNAAMIPMVRGTTVFAILAVSGRQEAMMSDDIIKHLETLAAMGALAYDNAEVHQQESLASRTDPLTGLGNRRALEERASQLPRVPYAVIAIDVDRLKEVNDSRGHDAGDMLLSGVATAMAGQVRPSDVLVRTGGDEFVALLVGCDATGAAEAAGRFRGAVSIVTLPWGSPSISLGIAAGKAGESPQAVLARADADLYAAKRRR